MRKSARALALIMTACLCACGQHEIARHGEQSPGPDHVDWTDTLGYVERAVLAYDTDEAILARYPGSEPWADPVTDVRAFLDVEEGTGVQWLAVRGTANLKNGLADMEYTKAADPRLGIFLHAGFTHGSAAVLDWARPRLDKTRPVRISGHSLGGAIAVIVEAYLIEAGYDVEGCVTIGQPKVTNAAGARVLKANPLLRLLNEDDVVPTVPPVTVISSIHGIYRHFGPEAILTKDGEFIYLHEHDAERIAVTSAWANVGHLSVQAHGSALYLERVRRLAQADRDDAVPSG